MLIIRITTEKELDKKRQDAESQEKKRIELLKQERKLLIERIYEIEEILDMENRERIFPRS